MSMQNLLPSNKILWGQVKGKGDLLNGSDLHSGLFSGWYLADWVRCRSASAVAAAAVVAMATVAMAAATGSVCALSTDDWFSADQHIPLSHHSTLSTVTATKNVRGKWTNIIHRTVVDRCSAPYHGTLNSHVDILQSVTHGQSDARPTLTSQLHSIATQRPVPSYTAWWQHTSHTWQRRG